MIKWWEAVIKNFMKPAHCVTIPRLCCRPTTTLMKSLTSKITVSDIKRTLIMRVWWRSKQPGVSCYKKFFSISGLCQQEVISRQGPSTLGPKYTFIILYNVPCLQVFIIVIRTAGLQASKASRLGNAQRRNSTCSPGQSRLGNSISEIRLLHTWAWNSSLSLTRSSRAFGQVSGTPPLRLAVYFHSGWNKIPVGLFFVVYSCDCVLHQRCIPLASTPSGTCKSFPQSRLLRSSTSFLVPYLCTPRSLLSLLLHILHTSFSSDRFLPSYFRGCPGLEPFLSNSVIPINYQDPESRTRLCC